jgi:predicted DNA-binding protein YlxM (UPF0122 family)
MAAATIFTEKELKVLKLKLQGIMNREIAQQLNVSEEDISQTLSKIRQKIHKVEDSIRLCESLGLIESGPRFRLTDEGKRLIAKSRVARQRFLAPVIMGPKPRLFESNEILKNFYPSARLSHFQPSSLIYRSAPWMMHSIYIQKQERLENQLRLYSHPNN